MCVGGGGGGGGGVDCTPVGKLLLVVQTRSVHSLVASHHLQSVAATMIFRFTVESSLCLLQFTFCC